MNPGGVATCGWVIRDDAGELVASDSRMVCKGDGATNNVAEWCALGFALRYMADSKAFGNCDLMIRGDSQLVVFQLIGKYKCNAEHLRKLRDRCLAVIDEIGCTSWKAEWIKRDENEEADALSRKAYEDATGKRFPERVRR